jgi:Tfp pilus assembly protein PilN
MSLIPIPGTSMVRDTNSMALINRDANGLQEYQNKRNFLASQRQEINNMKSDIDDVKNDIKEIKQLMLQLIGKNSNG